MNKEEIFELVKKYNRNKCTPEEQAILETWYVKDSQLFQVELSENKINADLDDAFPALTQVQKRMKLWGRLVAAAACVALILGGYFFLYENKTPVTSAELTRQNDVNPGKNAAVLRLSNGQVIQLSDSKSGIVIKSDQLTYSDGSVIDDQNASSKGLQTITTPRGGKYILELPDKTTVWLNAESSLTYSNFLEEKGKRRFVKVEGEAYFEVAKDPDRPFVVSSNGAGGAQEITVLGTRFNINSYADEASTKTTLVEGSLKVFKGEKSSLLKPGQQSAVSDDIIVSEVDANQFLDWKNGNFYFEDENIKSIMRKLSRWYDIDVTYQGKIPEFGFGGEISRQKKLSEVLRLLEVNGIRFKIEGRRVKVMY